MRNPGTVPNPFQYLSENEAAKMTVILKLAKQGLYSEALMELCMLPLRTQTYINGSLDQIMPNDVSSGVCDAPVLMVPMNFLPYREQLASIFKLSWNPPAECGSVVLEIKVEQNGKLLAASLVTSSGFVEADNQALAIARAVHYPKLPFKDCPAMSMRFEFPKKGIPWTARGASFPFNPNPKIPHVPDQA